ncbi:hypothetical protein MCAL160_0528 [Mycoplasmopsis californica HAZ160_1]|uniref:ABC transporter ATP-binding protein n=1 Tax=Mycoplasmopsis californica HAZ160_1 TaxID=1397850 RepID=A0AAT9F887_9BACT|nr:hypothetical protein [Mycoplasmopsis californica]BAP01071.1 hypothetical protein MCAL160_0528 [Mycoplasmopsis californica HAZ160_1]BBG42706.1 hypothetical protein MCAL160E_0528 [Mycoplasmopsis californica]BBG43281.1 hypothetical protein MCAL160L_0528 [Mycoplasmopsis californica]
MTKDSKLFSIDMYFKPGKNKDTFSDIPTLKIRNNSANAFLILDSNSDMLKNCFKDIINSENCVKSMFLTDENGRRYETLNNKEIINAISFYGLDNLRTHQQMTPIAQEYSRIKQSYFLDKSRYRQLLNLMEVNEFKIKAIMLESFRNNINIIHSENTDFKRDFEHNFNSIIEALRDGKFEHALNLSKRHVENFDWFGEKIVYEFLELFQTLFASARKIMMEHYQSPGFLALTKLESFSRRYELVNQMQHTSKEMVKRQIHLRDIRNDKHIIEKLRKQNLKNGLERGTNLIQWYKSAVKILKNKSHFFDKKSPEYTHIWKNIITIKHIIKVLNRAKYTLRALTSENFDDLKIYLEARRSLFIANNLASNSLTQDTRHIENIKAIVKKEFYVDIEQYIEQSYGNDTIYTDELRRLKRHIKRIQAKKLNVFGIENYKNNLHHLKNRVNTLRAKRDWQKQLEREEFKRAINLMAIYNTNAKTLIKNYYSLVDFDRNSLEKLSQIIEHYTSKNEEEHKILYAIKENMIKVSELLKSISFLYDYVEILRSMLFVRFDLTDKSIKSIDIFIKLIKVLNNASFSISSLTKPMSNLSNISSLKIGLLSELMSGSKLLFINDDIKNTDMRLKNEFLRIANDLCKESNIAYAFITNNLELIKNHEFNNIFVFFDGKLIEFGKTRKVLKSPLHPILKRFLNSSYQPLQDINQISNYIFAEPFEFVSGHYIIAPNNIIKRLSADDLNDRYDGNEIELEATSIFDLESYNDTQDTMIVNLSQKDINTLEVDIDQQLTSEYATMMKSEQTNLTDTIFISHDDAF